ncbi:receptor-like kinase [Trifolium pratense]|uniref:non-specific serine/threonine protein kinase n=1 Tax=Trifolium pratense TaxID=57577 RepID=A0A2K3N0R3_TRIPR|nr:receptor-like kinase [Trifolium pratense]
MYQIAIGIARGLEYLHQGCISRILHLDIKPQNILLDENFCPKISDFGLAKICQRNDSVVSILGTRGTIGYIAPEVFSRTYGGVSHKSDVYSYDWIYKDLEQGNNNLENCLASSNEENDMVRKITMVESLGGKRYAYVMVDDFSRYTWISFIKEKSENFDVFKELCIQLQREKDNVVLRIRSDHGKEFENSKFSKFCASEGIVHEFASPITPQKNGVVERKNRTLQESARVMLHAKKLPYSFWAEAMNTACYIHNRIENQGGRWKSEEGIFLGYATNNKTYRVYNPRTKTMMGSINVVVEDTTGKLTTSVAEDAIASDLSSDEAVEVKQSESDAEAPIPEPTKTPKKGPSIRIQKNHPIDLIIGNPDQGIATRRTNDVYRHYLHLKSKFRFVVTDLTHEVASGGVESETLRGTNSKVSNLHHQTNPKQE